MAASPPIAQECVEGYLFVPAPFALLILRRPPSRDSVWVPVSGKIERYDRDARAAVVREVAEETGFVSATAPIDLDWPVDFEGPDGRRWRLRAYAMALEARWSPTLSAEHVAWEWVSADGARARLHFPDNRAAVDRLLEAISAPP